MIKQYIKIKTDFEATHNWPDCPIEEVSFLKFPHRHKIYINVIIETTNDRQIEFFVFKRQVDECIDQLYGTDRVKKLGSRSMETICNELLKLVSITYNETYIKIEASEDNQVSGIVENYPNHKV